MRTRVAFRRNSRRISIPVLLLAASAGVLPLFCPPAFGQAAGEESGDKPAEQVFKNIQVFQGVPASQLMPAMSFMRSSLGVQCSFCHVGEREFDKDDKQEKGTARKMIRMVRDINQASFNGRNEVTCNTCHHGQAHPQSLLSFADPSGKQAPAPSAEGTRSAEPLPTADQVLDKYEAALGGRPALEKVGTRVMKGTRSMSQGRSMPIEIYQKAPDKMLMLFGSNMAMGTGFDGTAGWSRNPRGIQEARGPGLVRLKREAVFAKELKVRDEYRNLRVIGRLPVGERQAYVVQGVVEGERSPERLYFDVESGLLLRVSSRESTPLGPLPGEIDFEDYRAVDGIKLPFTVLHLQADRSYKDVFSEIVQNTTIDDARFSRPADDQK